MEKDIIQDMPSNSPSGGSRLSTIFFVVLGLHVLVILGIGAFHLLRGDSSQSQIAAAEQQPNQTAESNSGYSDANMAQNNMQQASAPVYNTGALPNEYPNGMVVSQAQQSNGLPVMVQGQAQAASAQQFGLPVTEVRPSAAQQTQSWNQAQAQPQQPNQMAQSAQPVMPTRVIRTAEQYSAASNAAPSHQQQAVYTVVKGDTLFKIARQTHTTVQKLRDANGLKSDMLKIGQKLTLPGSGQMQVASRSAQPAAIPAQAATPAQAPASLAPQPASAQVVENVQPINSQPASSVVANESGYSLHKVTKGETLVKIARVYNTTATNLAKINQINDPTKLKIGMELKVPSQTAKNNWNTSNTQASNSNAAQQGAQGNTETGNPASFRTPANSQDLAMLRPDSNN